MDIWQSMRRGIQSARETMARLVGWFMKIGMTDAEKVEFDKALVDVQQADRNSMEQGFTASQKRHEQAIADAETLNISIREKLAEHTAKIQAETTAKREQEPGTTGSGWGCRPLPPSRLSSRCAPGSSLITLHDIPYDAFCEKTKSNSCVLFFCRKPNTEPGAKRLLKRIFHTRAGARIRSRSYRGVLKRICSNGWKPYSEPHVAAGGCGILMGTIIGIKDGSFSGSETRSSAFEKRKRKYSVVFEIVADDVDETWTQILTTPKLPRLLQDWKGDGCRCKSRTPKEAHTIHFNGRLTILWEVECQFDSEIVFRDTKEDDPLTWPTTLSISSQEVTEDLLKDAETGDPIVNPNGERIHIEVPNSYPVIEFSRYEPYPDTPAGIAAFISKMNRFKNRLNSDEFMGFEPGTCFLYAPQTTREQINGRCRYDRRRMRVPAR